MLMLLRKRPISSVVACILAAWGFHTGCTVPNGSGNGGGGGDTTVDPAEVDGSLQALGVDTGFTNRVDEYAEGLPDDFTPLGRSCQFAKTDELFMINVHVGVAAPGGDVEYLDDGVIFSDLVDDDSGVVRFGVTDVVSPAPVWQTDTSGHPQLNGSGLGAQAHRSAVATDLDADGIDEIAVAYLDLDAPARANEIWLEVIDKMTETGDSSGVFSIADIADVTDVSAVAGDFDGDGQGDVAVGWATTDSVGVVIATRQQDGTFATQDVTLPQFSKSRDDAALSLELAAGNLDFDAGDELVVVVNQSFGSPTDGTTNYWVLDDGNAGFAPRITNANLIIQADGTHLAKQTDVAVGDIDADGRDEVIFAGMEYFLTDSCDAVSHLLLAMEDMADQDNPLGVISAKHYEETWVVGGGCSAVTDKLLARTLLLNTIDIDGDGVDEIQVARRFYEDFAHADPWTPAGPADNPYMLPDRAFRHDQNQSGGTVADATSQVVVGDFNGDGRQDLATYIQWRNKISVYGLIGPAADTATFEEYLTVPTSFNNGQSIVFPILVPCNVDIDGLALKYSDGSYALVFTEPVLIAALAAAPCANGIGQNVDDCVTSYGQSESQDIGVDGTITVSASVFVGGEAKIPVFDVGVETEQRVTASASFSAGRSYSLEETVEFTTGPIEDTVVFTTIPVDQYTYTVLSHPDPTLVGSKVTINLPRSPITLQVTREFYNSHVPAGSFQVGSNVFQHTPGNIDSYPTEGDADALIDTGGLAHLGPLGELVDAAGEAIGPIAGTLLGNGLKSSRTTSVGQGSGSTSTEIRFSQSTSYRAGAEIAYEKEIAVSGGVGKVGVAVGGSVEAGISWGGSTSTIYRGSVGSIDAENFASNGYSFGLFTYIYNYGNPAAQQFEVVNYWVTR